jgi:hypothetical protein
MPSRLDIAQLNSGQSAGCLALFFVPFAAAGALCAVEALQRARAGSWHDATFLGIAALTFGGVGLGGLAGIRIGLAKVKEVAALQAAHPDEPWLWRRDWAGGRIQDASRQDQLGAWIFALFWNLVSLPAAYAGVRAALGEGKRIGLIALLFPLVGVWLLGRAVHLMLRQRKYGISLLELTTIPGVIAGELAGTVRVPSWLQPPGGFQATLTCLRRVTTRSGKNSSTSETVLWHEEHRIVGEQSRDYSGMKTSVPISFRLPPDAIPSDPLRSNNQVVWRLRVWAGLPGVDYDSTFEVPIFRRTPD